MSADRFGPEISDLVVDYDPETLARRDVTKQAVLERLREAGTPARAHRIARRLVERDDEHACHSALHHMINPPSTSIVRPLK